MIATKIYPPVPKEVGHIEVYKQKWQDLSGDNPYFEFEKLALHPCSAVELGLEKSDEFTPHLFPMSNDSDPAIFMQDALCIEREELELYGTFESNSARLLHV